jgi:hypothetical protein
MKAYYGTLDNNISARETVRESQPLAVMSSYSRRNGTYNAS